jgi:hypothetical protein
MVADVARTVPGTPCSWRASGGTHLADPVTTTKEGRRMPQLSTAQRNRLKDDQFAYIDKDGERHLPIHDEEHVRNAIRRFSRTHFESQAAKARAAKAIMQAARHHDIDVGDDDDVAQAAT